MKNAFVHPAPGSPKSLYLLSTTVAVAALWAYLTPIDVSIRSRGIVRPEGLPVRIVAEVSGRIQTIYVKEGDHVRMGDPLVQLDIRELSLKRLAIETRIQFTELRLADLERQTKDKIALDDMAASVDLASHDASQRAADLNLDSARLRLARTQLLLREGLIARQAYEESHLAVALAESEKARLSTKSLELKRSQSAADIRTLMAQSTPLRADFASLRHDLDQTRLEIVRLTITAPNDGQITSLAAVHIGEFLSAGTTLAAVVPSSHSLIIESWLPTSDRSYIDEGQTVRLRSESFAAGDSSFDGIISSISPDAHFNESFTGSYRVLITPGPSQSELRLGMTFAVNFITRQDRLLWIVFGRIRMAFR